MNGELVMDGGPFRVSRPAERRAVSRSESTSRPVETSQAPVVEQKSVRQTNESSYEPSRTKPTRRWVWPLLLLALLLLGVLGWFTWSQTKGSDLAIDKNKYQAVFFTNGQVYFGKLKSLNGEYMQLSNIYYLQTQTAGETESENPQETSTEKSDVELIKLGDEIHGPEDMMVISRDQMLFFENLKTDSKVTQSIQKFKSAK